MSPKLLELIDDCGASDNEMWYVDHGEMDNSEVLKLKEEIASLDKKYSDLKLSEYITFNQYGFLVIVWGY